MSRKAFLIPISIIAVFMALSITLVSSCAPPTSSSMFGERIGLLYVEGVIMSGHQTDMFFGSGGATSDHIVQVIEQAIQDDSIKAIVVRINSPGGSAAASQEIFQAFKKFTATGRPLIVSMADYAASGGYYIAAPANEIFANPSTLTGSIGVIMQLMNYEGLYEIIGLDDTTIKSGEFKDIGSATRPMTAEEEILLQEMLDQTHQQFKDAVMEGRGFKEEDIEKIATGMIFNGQQAMENGLVDSLGGLQDAIDRAADLTGLAPDPQIDELGKVGLLDELLGELGAVQAPGGIAGDLSDALSPLTGANPFYRLWSMALLDTRLLGENAGVRY